MAEVLWGTGSKQVNNNYNSPVNGSSNFFPSLGSTGVREAN